MRTTQYIVLSAALFVVFSVVAVDVAGAQNGSGEVVGNPDLDVVVTENVLVPGEENVVEFYVLNEGSIRQSGPPEYVDRVTTARGTTVEFTSRNDDVEVITGPVAVGTAPPGSTGPFTVRLDVDEATDAGNLRLSAHVEYDYTRVVKYGETSRMSDLWRDTRKSVEFRVRSDARFKATASTDARLGERGRVTVTLRNTGDAGAHDAIAAVTARDEVVGFDGGAPNATAEVGFVESGETVEARLPAVFGGDGNVRGYPLDVDVRYEDDRGIERVSHASASVTPRDELRFEVRGGGTVRPGGVGTVSGELVNYGDAVEDVVLRIHGDETVSVRQDSVSVGDVSDNATRTFSLRTHLSAGVMSNQELVVEPLYTSDGERYTADEERLDISVGESRDAFDVRAQETEVTPGAETDVVFAVESRLDASVRNVTVTAESGEPVEIDYGEAFVGDAPPDAAKTVAFGVDVSDDATPRSYPIRFVVEYTDTAGETVTTTSVANVDVVEDDNAVLFDDAAPVAVVVALLLGIGWWVYGKNLVRRGR